MMPTASNLDRFQVLLQPFLFTKTQIMRHFPPQKPCFQLPKTVFSLLEQRFCELAQNTQRYYNLCVCVCVCVCNLCVCV